MPLTLVAVALPPYVVQAQEKVLAESWEAAYLQGTHSGYVRTTIQETSKGSQKLLRGNIELRLHVKRFNDAIQLAMDSGTVETTDGKVIGTHMRQYLGKNKTVDISGQVEGRRLLLILDGSKPLHPAPWDESVVGVVRQRTMFEERRPKPGDSFNYRSFEPTINLVITAHVTAKNHEEVDLAGKQKRKLLRVETRIDKVQDLQLPPLINWLDDAGRILRTQLEVPGIGKVLLYPATKAIAMAPTQGAPALDVGASQYLRLNKKILRPHHTTSAIYRITFKGDEDVNSIFVLDSRQQAKNVRNGVLDLIINAAIPSGSESPPDAEFIQTSYFINSSDSKVKELTRLAVGSESDPWLKAVRIERWVKNRMVVRNHEALATADQVARTLEGDCTEFAMLTAAMCRAAGIPSRTAMGLIYADVRTGPVFAFHMWTEVWIEGQWRGLDATLGQGRIGAAHLKIADQSWHGEQSLTPLLPVIRVLGKLSIEVVDVRY